MIDLGPAINPFQRFKGVQTTVVGQRLTRHCIANGVSFQLHACDETILAAMLDVLPFGTETVGIADLAAACFSLCPRTHRRGFQLQLPNGQILQHVELPPLIQHFAQQVLLHVGIHAPEVVFVHAGAVAWRGYGLLFPGSSCAGKTTIVAELVKLGATYYSDDYALIDPHGLLHPYARDLQIRAPGTLEQESVPIENLRGTAGTEPIPIAQILLTEFIGDGRWNPQPLSPGLAVLQLLRHTIAARHRPAEVLAALRTVTLTATAWRSPRGEAHATARAILNVLDSREGPQ